MNELDKIAEIYAKYNVFNKLFDFPISGNYTDAQFPDGVVEILRVIKKDIISLNSMLSLQYPNIIIAIGSYINDKTGCELYTILYVPFNKVTDVLLLIYDNDEAQHIYSELIKMYKEHGHNKLPFVFAVSIQHDYNCIFQYNGH